MYMMYICSMFLSCFCNCALFVCSSHVEEIKNIIIIIIFIIIIRYYYYYYYYYYYFIKVVCNDGFVWCFLNV